MAMISPNIDL